MALKGMNKKARSGMHYGNTRIEFYSNKNRCRIVAESMLEYIEYMRLEIDSDVISYTPHPGIILIVDESQNTHRSIFDAELHLADGNTVYEEIKYSSELENDQRSIRQTRMQEEWCKRKGYEYRIITEKMINNNPVLLNNCVFICQRLRNERVENQVLIKAKAHSIYEMVKEKERHVKVFEFVSDNDDLEDIEIILTSVCFLITNGLVDADIEKVNFSLGSEVWINERQEICP